jgi:hypothetical protein
MVEDQRTTDDRFHVSLLSRQERAALDWLAPRLPAYVTPDLLTAFGLFGALVTFAGYALCALSPQFLWLASAGLVMNWFTITYFTCSGALTKTTCLRRILKESTQER